jgi:hypothetical protein
MSEALIGAGCLIVLAVVFGLGFSYGWKSSEEANDVLRDLFKDSDKH